MTWFGIGRCISQARILSGFNLAVFGPSRLRLEVETSTGSRAATALLSLRCNSNQMLAIVPWGNVAVNVLLTLLSDSVLARMAALVFATFAITIFGEIVRKPILRAMPSALLLDLWLDKEAATYFREHEMRELIRAHNDSENTEVDRLEGLGAKNFLEMDDLTVLRKGGKIDPESIVSLPFLGALPVFAKIERASEDPFLQRTHRSGRKWVIITRPDVNPAYIPDSEEFLRGALLGETPFDPHAYCHRPVIVWQPRERPGNAIGWLHGPGKQPGAAIIEYDIILVRTHEKRVITGADILGRLLSGASTPARMPNSRQE